MTDLHPNIPSKLDKYVLHRVLGAGAWSIVFEAENLQTGGSVAVKVLRPEIASTITIERFVREIRVVAGLSHPHIVPVFDAGVQDTTVFCVMQLAGYETLRERLQRVGPLSLDEVRQHARNLGSALAYAHEQGVIHRDVKPANILMSPGGVRLTDFGIARAATGDGDGTATTSGYFLGTRAYASPEQLRSETGLDAATDQYALACVLFEVLTGRPPYVADANDIVSAHLGAPIPSARSLRQDVTPAMDAALARALAKRSTDRFKSVGEFVGAFLADVPIRKPVRWRRRVGVVLAIGAVWPLAKWYSDSQAKALPGVAVVPCRNNSGLAAQDYAALGFADELTSRLSTLVGLRVISHQSMLRYGDSPSTPREVGREVGVEHLVYCSTNRQADSIRVRVDVVVAATEAIRSTHAYVADTLGILGVYGEVAEDIADTLLPRRRRRAAPPPTTSDSAWQLYLRGRAQWNIGSVTGLRSSLELLTLATQVDPNFAKAFSAMADAHLSFGGRWMAPPEPHFQAARIAVDRALSLQPRLGEALAARGRLRYRGEWDWRGAERDFIESHGRYENGWQGWLDHAKMASSLGRHEEAIGFVRRAAEVGVADPFVLVGVAEVVYAARQYEQALVDANRAIAIAPEFPFAYLWKAMILISLRRPGEAVLAAREAAVRAERHPGVLAILARAHAEAGQPDSTRAILAEMDRGAYVPATLRAIVHLGLGNADAAMDALERAADERDWFIVELAVHPLADGIRDHPRMPALLKRLGLDRVPRPTG